MRQAFLSCVDELFIGVFIAMAAQGSDPVGASWFRAPGRFDLLVWGDDAPRKPQRKKSGTAEPKRRTKQAPLKQEKLLEALPCGCFDQCQKRHDEPPPVEQLARDRTDIVNQLTASSLVMTKPSTDRDDHDFDVVLQST
jgi:hypothetical protein